MKKKLVTVLAGAALVLSLSACGGKEESTSSSTGTTTQTASSGSDGDKLYQKSCASCHGGNLEGSVGPNLQKVGAKYSPDEIQNIITNGRGSMPAGIISGEDATKVASWLAEKK